MSRVPEHVKWSLVGTTLGVGLLNAATRNVDFAELGRVLHAADSIWVAAVLGPVFSFIAIKTWRWKLLLRFVPNIQFRELHSAVYITHLFSA